MRIHYYKYLLTIFAILLSISATASVVELYKEANIISNNAQILEVFNPKGATNTKEIVKVTDDGKNYIIKVFVNKSLFLEEAEGMGQITAITKHVKELGEKFSIKLPQFFTPFAKGQDESKSIFSVIMHEAPGIELSSFSADNIDSDSVRKVFVEVGKSFGALDSLLYRHNDGKLISHPDGHGGNIYFDEKTNTVSWIDLTGLKYLSGRNGSSLMQTKFFAKYLLSPPPSVRSKFRTELQVVLKNLNIKSSVNQLSLEKLKEELEEAVAQNEEDKKTENELLKDIMKRYLQKNYTAVNDNLKNKESTIAKIHAMYKTSYNYNKALEAFLQGYLSNHPEARSQILEYINPGLNQFYFLDLKYSALTFNHFVYYMNELLKLLGEEPLPELKVIL